MGASGATAKGYPVDPGQVQNSVGLFLAGANQINAIAQNATYYSENQIAQGVSSAIQSITQAANTVQPFATTALDATNELRWWMGMAPVDRTAELKNNVQGLMSQMSTLLPGNLGGWASSSYQNQYLANQAALLDNLQNTKDPEQRAAIKQQIVNSMSNQAHFAGWQENMSHSQINQLLGTTPTSLNFDPNYQTVYSTGDYKLGTGSVPGAPGTPNGYPGYPAGGNASMNPGVGIGTYDFTNGYSPATGPDLSGGAAGLKNVQIPPGLSREQAAQYVYQMYNHSQIPGAQLNQLRNAGVNTGAGIAPEKLATIAENRHIAGSLILSNAQTVLGALDQYAPDELPTGPTSDEIFAKLIKEPGYVTAELQGEQAVQRSQAASGILNSGNAAIQLQAYGQNFANQAYQQKLANLSGLVNTMLPEVNQKYQGYLTQAATQAQAGMQAASNTVNLANNQMQGVGNMFAGAGNAVINAAIATSQNLTNASIATAQNKTQASMSNAGSVGSIAGSVLGAIL